MGEVTGPRAVSFLVLPILPDAVRLLPAACLTANSDNQLCTTYSVFLLAHFAVPRRLARCKVCRTCVMVPTPPYKSSVFGVYAVLSCN
jgi:hypothetical protein